MKRTSWSWVVLAVLAAAEPGSGQGVHWTYPSWIESGFVPSAVSENDWTRWLIGEWEGWLDDGITLTPMRQTFEPTGGGRYVLTQIRIGEGPDAYEGTGIFGYDVDSGVAYGEWFGSAGDRNDGRGKWEGDRASWEINRPGRRVLRIRERLGPDRFRVVNESTDLEGRVRRSTEALQRLAPPPRGDPPPGPLAEHSEPHQPASARSRPEGSSSRVSEPNRVRTRTRCSALGDMNRRIQPS